MTFILSGVEDYRLSIVFSGNQLQTLKDRERTVNDSWKSELKKQIDESLYDENTQDNEKPEENPAYFDTLYVPYIAGFLKSYQKISDV